MTTNKIIITANANWFTIILENNASWILPKDKRILYTSQGSETKSVFSLSNKELLCEAASDDFIDFNVELYVETDENNLALRVETERIVTVKSDIDSITVENTGEIRFSLRLK